VCLVVAVVVAVVAGEADGDAVHAVGLATDVDADVHADADANADALPCEVPCDVVAVPSDDAVALASLAAMSVQRRAVFVAVNRVHCVPAVGCRVADADPDC